LQVDENDGRRGRAKMSDTDVSSGFSGSRDQGDFQRRQLQCDEQSVCSSVTAATGDLQNSLRKSICEFVDGRIPGIAFRRQLHQSGVPVPPDLDRLIRTHEHDNSVSFGAFARVVLRQDRQDNIDRGSFGGFASNSFATNSPGASVPPSPAGTGRPFVAGGGWSDHDRRPSQPPSEAGSSVAGSQVPLRAPFATCADLPPAATTGGGSRSGYSTPGGVPVFRPPSAPATSRSGSAWNGGGGAYRGGYQPSGVTGDFMRWDEKGSAMPSAGGTPRQQSQSQSQNDHPDSRSGVSRGWSPPPQSRRAPQQGNINDMADCLSWPASRESEKPSSQGGRPGKSYGARPAASEILPWAADSENSYGNRQQQSNSIYAAPFGTDKDVQKGPYDAGTSEYQPQRGEDRRNRVF